MIAKLSNIRKEETYCSIINRIWHSLIEYCRNTNYDILKRVQIQRLAQRREPGITTNNSIALANCHPKKL